MANLYFDPQLCRISSRLLFWFFFLQTSVGKNHRRKGLTFKLVILLTGSTSKLLTVLQTTKSKHNQVKLTCLINFWVIHISHSGNIFWNNQLQCKQHEVILTVHLKETGRPKEPRILIRVRQYLEQIQLFLMKQENILNVYIYLDKCLIKKKMTNFSSRLGHVMWDKCLPLKFWSIHHWVSYFITQHTDKTLISTVVPTVHSI